jgi:hypothetical protein
MGYMQMPRVDQFLEVILPVCWKGRWLTVDEMTDLTKLHPSSVRWCLKQLSTGAEGDFIIRRRRRPAAINGPMEFYIKRKPAQMRLPYGEQTA